MRRGESILSNVDDPLVDDHLLPWKSAVEHRVTQRRALSAASPPRPTNCHIP